MVRFFEMPDVHYDADWFDVFNQQMTSVYNAIIYEQPDFLALVGDFFNRPAYASDRSLYGDMLQIMRGLAKRVPIVAVEGTPSHDGPGAYAALEAIGVTLLKPGVVYGLDKSDGRVYPVVNHGWAPDAVLFGVPELRKDQALSFGSEERSGETLELFRRYVAEFVAPARAAYPNAPAIGLLHGVVSDSISKENEIDVAKRASSLLIKAEDLRPATLDRWALGDIHQPWESKTVCAGYAGFAGMDDRPWNSLGFLPSFNVTTIQDNGSVEIAPRSYGLPSRKKITEPLASYDPKVAYWLESSVDDPELDPAKHGAHPWSRFSYKPTKRSTRREGAAVAEAGSVRPLADLLEAMQPGTVTPSIREKAEKIDRGGRLVGAGSNVKLRKLVVSGCVLLHERTATLNVPDEWLSAIVGDNGAGKSSLLSFATPYPAMVGKDTFSGRDSAIQEFFTRQPAGVEKWFDVDGVEHRHVIEIKGAGAKSASVECYLYVDGKNALSTKSFAEMFSKCEALYGSFEDYLTTTFSVQPQQSRKDSSIMGATSSELYARVLRISGIDRSAEAAEARDEVAKASAIVSGELAKTEALRDVAGSLDELRENLETEEAIRDRREKELSDRKLELAKAEEEKSAARARLDKASAERSASRKNQEAIAESVNEKDAASAIVALADKAERTLEFDDGQRAKLAIYERETAEARATNAEAEAEHARELAKYERETGAIRTAYLEEFSAVDRRNDTLVSKHRAELAAWENRVADYKASVERYNQERERAERNLKTAQAIASDKIRDAEALAEPCEACGHIKESAAAAIKEAELAGNRIVEAVENEIAELRAPEAPDDLETPPVEPKLEPRPIAPELRAKPEEPRLIEIPARPDLSLLSDYGRAEFEKDAKAGADARAKLEALRARISELRERSFDVDPEAEIRLQDAERKLERSRGAEATARTIYDLSVEAVTRLKAKIEEAERIAERIAESDKIREAAGREFEDWNYLAAALRPNKLPAFELDLALDAIDEKATRYVAPYREGIYTIRSETQTEGKAGTVDRFRVVVHDGETGLERGITQFSPGEKAFLADAYQKALTDIGFERRGAKFSPVLLDEADGPIRASRIPEFYRIQQDYFKDTPVLVVSHAPDAANFIQRHIAMEEVLS